MNTLTDAFDAVLQVDQLALQEIYRAMHQAGTVEHHYVRAHHGRRVELSMAAPLITLQMATTLDGRLRGQMLVRVYYHERSLADAVDPGDSAVADVVVRACLEIPGGDPAPINADAVIVIDWDETTGADITVHGAAPALEAAVRGALLDFIHEEGAGTFGLGPLAQVGASSVTLRAIAAWAPRLPVLAVGLNLGPGPKGSRAGLQTVFCQQDWALALSRDYVLGRVRDALAAQLGSQLPPPLGAAPVVVSDTIVCTLETPFGCWDRARQRVFLDSLSVDLVAGAVVFSGTVRQVTDAWYVPTLSANWTASVTLGIGPNQILTATTSQPSVQLQEWYGVVTNFLTAGLLEKLVRDSIAAVLQAGLASGEVSQLFSLPLRQLAAIGGPTQVDITPTATSIEVRPEALIVHGTLAGPATFPVPTSTFAVLPTPSPTRLVFHAGESWAPGGSVIQYHWDFGDGTSETTAGTVARFVTHHVYTPGSYLACLTVTDNRGRTSKICQGVQPGILVLRHIPDPASRTREGEICLPPAVISVDFAVMGGGAPVADVLVTVIGTGWQLSRYTDGAGRVRFELDPVQVTTAGITDPPPSRWHRGGVRVTATKIGYQQSETQLWMIDCAGRLNAELQAKAHRDYVLDRLAGYAFLRELIKSGALRRKPPPTGPVLEGPDMFGRPTLGLDPRARAATEIGLALDVLTKITHLLESNSPVLSVAELLGIDAEGAALTEALNERLGQLWRHVDAAADAYDRKFRP